MSYIFYRKNKENIRTRQRKVKGYCSNEDASHYLKMFCSWKQSPIQANTQTVHYLVKEVCDSIVQVMFSVIKIDDLMVLPLVEDI